MNTALLREARITVYKSVRQESPFGGWNTEWQMFKTYRAGILDKSMSYNITEDEYYHPEYKTFLVRHYVNILPEDRIEYQGIMYDITSVETNTYFNNKVIKCQKHKD